MKIRIGTRAAMTLVAAAALALGIAGMKHRFDRCRALAEGHGWRLDVFLGERCGSAATARHQEPRAEVIRFHRAMRDRYRAAMWRPWKAVPADVPWYPGSASSPTELAERQSGDAP